MSEASPIKLAMLSIAIFIGAMKVKEHCHLCYIALVFIGLGILIYAAVKHFRYKLWEKKRKR
ncbi:hypothetical protein [Aureivirga sp. CE67]|uniref:hypothetical protein n=1 Tax=Aureivirga sp. CE67 TaxID=1788983 RepID=UPI0018CB1240|nr:hypothetical protein [Aureivirga sp. CE67]